ncbi:hypothetical protein [Actinopolymorpha rutila]|uniref:Uncharacterized protein n=1 Tax=Actinopolymorpha rutila TaxID=446787 RepID=A0A852ZU08_9ACTN|nr:hypothetical protein [Actinopolymorpha rutila]NYH92480.1 hypothetical protein [Actinopolymorpha rutila]
MTALTPDASDLPSWPRLSVFCIHHANRLPALARERLASTTLAQGQVAIDAHRGAHIIARRAIGGEEVVWLVAVENGLDTSDLSIRTAIDTALEGFRSAHGF